MASAAFTFTGAAGTLLKLQTTAGATVEATLDNLAGVQSAAWDIFSTDETGTSHTISTSGTRGSVASLTAGIAGTAGILRCTVNGDTTATAKWFVPSANGAEVGCVNETTQSDATYHTTGLLNAAIRNTLASADVTAVSNATPDATADTFALRDGSGGLSFGYVTFGTNPASAGYIRAATNTTIVSARNAGNTGNWAAVGSDANGIVVGPAAAEGANLTLRTQTSGTIPLYFGAVNYSTLGPGYVAIRESGSNTYSSTGSLRFDNGGSIWGRNSSDTNDIGFIGLDGGTNLLVIGINSEGLGFFGVPETGSGVGVAFFANAATLPTTNPSSGVIVYADAGALKARGTSGTITTVAPAEPHCPRCGRDFALEWKNGSDELSVCVSCLVDALDKAGFGDFIIKRTA